MPSLIPARKQTMSSKRKAERSCKDLWRPRDKTLGCFLPVIASVLALVLHTGKPALSECICLKGGIWIPKHHQHTGRIGERCARTSLEELHEEFPVWLWNGCWVGRSVCARQRRADPPQPG